MRVPFKNLGQAELYLKTCNRKLTDHLKFTSNERLPTQRVRNAFCRGFGYSSYDELRLILSRPVRDFSPLASEEVFLDTFTKGFLLAFELAAKYKPSPGVGRNLDQYMAPMLAQGAVDELKREGSACELFTQTPKERAEELMNHGWGIFQNISPLNDIPKHYLAEAEEKFSEAVAANPELADAYNGLAFIEFSRGNYAASRRYSEAALEKARKSLDSEAPDAFSWYSELETRPYMRARHNLGLSLMRMGEWQGAVSEFRELLKRNPNDNQGVRYLIGPLYHLAGDLRHAIPAYRKAAGNNERSGDPHNECSYALALYETGKYEEAVLRFRYATFLNLHIPQALLGLPVKRLGIWYGSNHAEPAYAIKYAEEYGPMWGGKTDALAFLRAVYFHFTVKAEIEEYIKLGLKLAKTHDINQRVPIVNGMSRLKGLWRLRENNKVVVEEVVAAWRHAKI